MSGAVLCRAGRTAVPQFSYFVGPGNQTLRVRQITEVYREWKQLRSRWDGLGGVDELRALFFSPEDTPAGVHGRYLTGFRYDRALSTSLARALRCGNTA